MMQLFIWLLSGGHGLPKRFMNMAVPVNFFQRLLAANRFMPGFAAGALAAGGAELAADVLPEVPAASPPPSLLAAVDPPAAVALPVLEPPPS